MRRFLMGQLVLAVLCSLLALTALAQTPAPERMAGFEARQAMIADSPLTDVPFRNVGPTVMSGRVVDLDVSPSDPTQFYVAYASGGLWVTRSNGTHMEPIFDDEAVMTIGDVAVDWDNGETIWLGTGENNSSRSSYAGTGVYKSTDGGESWMHLGLEETQHIGRIVLHPDDANTAWVASLGKLYSANPERGVYKTTDGGATWSKTLFVDDGTGVVDLVIDPANADVLYAAAWHRGRSAWNFVEGGTTSGIYKSTDGGDSWTRVTVEGSGFPADAGVGRIGLDMAVSEPNTIFAVLDNQNRRPKENEEDGLTADLLLAMSRAEFLALPADSLQTYLDAQGFPSRYQAATVLGMVRSNEIEPSDVVNFTRDANRLLFDTPVIGAEVYRSDDGGMTWAKTNIDYIDDTYYSYGYYFGQLRVDPNDADKLYISGVPLLRSDDGGQTWFNIGRENVHVDHHALWINPSRPGHLVNGNDGGVNISYDDGDTWLKLNSPSVGQFYTVAVDSASPYNVYGGLQDNGVWKGPSTYEASRRWESTGDYPFDYLAGGDGMQVQVDPRDNTTVYTGSQFGFYARYEDGRRAARMRPQHDLGERPLRYNWQTPIHLSRHNRDVIYMGSNKIHRSLDQGETFEALSGDLTRGGRPGDVPYGTLTSLDESPLKFGLLYAGSDDGLVHVSRDAGTTWTRISDSFPSRYADWWVSRVEASHHEAGRVYVAINGYRFDDFEAVLFRSDDYGETWTRIGTNVPAEPVNVVLEDSRNEDLLYVGTDHGLYASIDGGRSFHALGDLPATPVHDLVVQEREQDLVVGTHGRSIYVGDIAPIRAMTDTLTSQPVYVFGIDAIDHSGRWGNSSRMWTEPSEPSRTITVWSATAGSATLRVHGVDDEVLHEMSFDARPGLNTLRYDLSAGASDETDTGKAYLDAGTYRVAVTRAGDAAETALVVE